MYKDTIGRTRRTKEEHAEMLEKIIPYREMGWSGERIGRKLGTTSDMVRYLCRKHNIKAGEKYNRGVPDYS